MRFNLQDERVTSLQTEHKTLQATLAKLEERLKPYEEYQQQAIDVVKQLQEVRVACSGNDQRVQVQLVLWLH